MSLPSRPADPLEWHPWYRDRTYLLDWLTTGRYRGVHRDALLVPFSPVITAHWHAADAPIASADMIQAKHRYIERHRVARPAPWTGRPFCYRWFVGVDDLGRQIATDSWISYEDGFGLLADGSEDP